MEKTMIKLSDLLNLEKIESYLDRYNGNNVEKWDYKERSDNYIRAREILNELCDKPLKNEEEFMELYEKLVGSEEFESFWHSGNLFRQKNRVAVNYREFIKFVKEIRSVSGKSARDVFDIILRYSNKISGLGVNVPTEVLNTYFPEKYAVLNKRPLTSLEYFKRSKSELPFPEDGNMFNSDNYEVFNSIMRQIVNRFKFESMGQADHFLSYVYSKDQPPPPPVQDEPDQKYIDIIDDLILRNAGKYKFKRDCSKEITFCKFDGKEILFFGALDEINEKHGFPVCYGVDTYSYPENVVSAFTANHNGKYIKHNNYMLMGLQKKVLEASNAKTAISDIVFSELSRLAGF